MAMRNFSHDLVNSIQLDASQCGEIVKKDCNNFLKTKQGLRYLLMKYPHLSVSQAVEEHIKHALWIDSIV